MRIPRTLQNQPSRYQVGTFIKTASPHSVEVLGTTPLDFGVLDAEHAPLDRSMLDLMLLAGRAAGRPGCRCWYAFPTSRPPPCSRCWTWGRPGCWCRMSTCMGDAEAVVRHARFRGGQRDSSSSPRFAGYGTLGMQQALAAGDQALVICQIESPQAVACAAGIAAVPGVDGLFIGRADLALAMGREDAKHPEVLAATEQCLAAALAAGKLAGVFTASLAERDAYAARGVNWFIFGSDQSLLRQGAEACAHPTPTLPL